MFPKSTSASAATFISFLTLSLLVLAPSALAATATVTTAADSGPGSLRAVAAAANPDDTITFDGSA